MKKIIFLAQFSLIAAGAFGQIQISAGSGIFMDMSFFNGYKIGAINVGYRNLGCSAYGFFDLTYAELGIGLGYGMTSKVVKRSPDPIPLRPDFGDFCLLDISVLGKFPFGVGRLTLFPLFGVSYKWLLYANEPAASSFLFDKKQFNQFGLLAGIGVNHDLAKTSYFCAEVLFHLRFPMEYIIKNLPAGAVATNGIGGRFKTGIGYKF